MNDRYRIVDPAPATTPRGLLRPVLWLALVLSAAADGVASTTTGNPYLSSGFGLVTLACAAGLVVHHYRRR